MKFEDIQEHLDGVPYIGNQQAKILYDFILDHKPEECLELGFAYGASVCYVAAALDELGRGHVTAVDLVSGQEWQHPSIEELLEKTGLQSYVTVLRENTSYTWFLKKKIEANTQGDPIYDFCYIDGPKNWTVDGCAFFLVNMLLKEGGWILFDDYDWAYDQADAWSVEKLQETGIMINLMGEDELKTPQIELVFKLLVMSHPDYSEFKIQDNSWGWAHKVADTRVAVVREDTSPLRRRVRRTLGL